MDKDLQAWREDVDKQLASLHAGQAILKGGHADLSEQVKINTEICSKVQIIVERLDENLSAIVSIITEGKGAFKLFSRLMNGIRWVLKYLVRPIFILVVFGYSIMHIDHIPKWIHLAMEFLEL